MKTKNKLPGFFLRQKEKQQSYTNKHTFHPFTRIVRGSLWVVIFALISGSIVLTLPKSQARVLGITQTQSDVRLAATTGVVVAEDTNISAQPTPRFTIAAKTPQGGCNDDSFYTASPQVTISFQNVSNLAQYQLVTNPVDFLTATWTDFPSQGCSGAATMSYNLTSIPNFNTIVQSRNQLILYARFRDKRDSSATITPTPPNYLSDSIYFGYPFIQTQRGDVHSNFQNPSAILPYAISGEASLTDYSKYVCNPPRPSSNADYVVSMSNAGSIQQVSGVPANCDTAMQSPSDNQSETFGTKGVTQEGRAMVVHLQDSVAIQNQVRFDDLINNATAECGSNVQTLDLGHQNAVTHLYDPTMDNCSPILDANGLPKDTSHGQIIHLIDSGTNPLNIIASQPLSNAPLGRSGAVVFVSKFRTININSDILYDTTGINGTINNLEQLAQLAVLTYGRDSNGNASDIIINQNVQNLVGTFFSERSTIYTSLSPFAKKLSIYGSLIAYDIQFNRTWLGQVQ